MISGSTRLVALLGRPVDESLSPRMQNAAFAARALDWAYVACDVAPQGLEAAIGGLVALGFAGSNVTAPHKAAAAELCDEAEGRSVNTLVFRDDRVLGFNTDKAIVAGIEAARVCLIGAGGAAEALQAALPGEVRVFSRSGEWPPEASHADLMPTALVEGARGAGCEVVDGLEALVRQGAASFELWTGVPAPVDVMRAAVRSG